MELRASILSPDELSEIDRATFQVLSEVGVSFASERACQIFEAAGAEVDRKTGIVKISDNLVRRSISSAARTRLELFDRSGTSFIRLEGKRTYSISGFDSPWTLDSVTGERHPCTKGEVGEFAKLSDALPNIHIVANQGTPQDVPPRSAELHAAEAVLNNTPKHCHFSPSDGEVAQAILEMVRLACERKDLSSKPPVTCFVSPTSPLRWEKNAIETLMESASSGIPLEIMPEPIPGITAPITLASVLLLQTVEIFGGLVLAQLIRRGTPVIYGYSPTVLDMHEATPIIAAPEDAIMRLASGEVAKRYGLPSVSTGPDTDAHVLDEQAGWEKAITGLAVYLGGADLMLNAGMFSSGLVVSYEQLVIDNEILGYLDRVVRGMRADRETLAVDLVRKVGHGGQFLKERHTLTQFEREHWVPGISCRAAFGRWMSKGGKDITQSAKEKARVILHEHHPQELPVSTRQAMAKIVDDFEARHSG